MNTTVLIIDLHITSAMLQRKREYRILAVSLCIVATKIKERHCLTKNKETYIIQAPFVTTLNRI